MSGFEIHRVAVGDTSFGHDDDGACGGHDVGDGHEVPMAAADSEPLHALVNGVAVLRNPGTTGEARGTKVQLKISVTANGDGSHAGMVDIQVNKFVPGPVKPELYRTGPQPTQLVQVQLLPAT